MLSTFLLFAWFSLPILVWGAMILAGRRVHSILVAVLCLASIIGGIFLLANYVWALDAQLLAEIDKYEPGTPEAQRASEEWASDTDRSFLLLFSPVVTAVWYGVLFLLLFAVQRAIRQMVSAKNTPMHGKTDSETAERRGDDGNPYQSSIVG